MNKTIKHMLQSWLPVGAAVLLLPALTINAFAQAAGAIQGARPSIKGAVLKGKAPVNKEILKVNLPKPYETKLKNGLQVMVLENHKLPIFSVQMVILSGGLADPAGAIGTADYTASLLREGTKTRDSKKIAEQIDSLGASLFAGASLTSLTSSVNASGLVENFDPIMELFADVLLNPSFPADELNKLKSRQLASIRLQRANPGFLAEEMFRKVIYGAHPGGRYALTAAQIQQVTPATLQQFHAKHYKPNNAIFAIVGDVKPAEIVAKLEKTFANWQPGDMPKTEIPPVGEAPASKIYLIDRPGSVQTNLVLGVPAIERTDPDYFALEMMNQTLGGGASSRLFLNLREDKGYTYGAYSGLSAPKYRGTFRATAEVRTEVTKGALDEFLYELKRICAEKAPAEEFERAQRTIVGGWALQLEFPQAVLQNAITQKLYHLPADYWDTYPQKIAAVTPAEVERVAQKYLNLGKLQIIAVGDAKQIIDALKAFGPVEIYDTEGKLVKTAEAAANNPAGSNANASSATAANIGGTWKLKVDSPNGEVELTALLKQDGAHLSGSLNTPFGEFPITGGSVNGNDVKFKAKVSVQGNELELEASATVAGDALKGLLNSAMIPNVPFTGKKEK